MFLFPEQRSFNVGGITVGGQMNNPCVLIGTIFYNRERIFSDKKFVKFDEKKAEEIISDVESLGEETGCPFMIDIYAESKKCIEERIDFVSDRTGVPFLIDSTDADVRIAGLAHAEEVGLTDRAVYNSINAGVTADEIRKLKGLNVDSCILLAFNPIDNSLNGRMGLLEDGGRLLNKGLLEIANDCGIKKIVIDTGITPLGEGAGPAIWSVMVAKARLGLPTGNGIHNAVSAWRWSDDNNVKRVVDAASNILPRVVGADFLLFGPIENAKHVFSCVALAECLIAEVMEEQGLTISGKHPYRQLI